jgi:uncharacterized membrane protein
MRALSLKLFDSLLRNFWFLPGFMMACAIGLYLIANTFNASDWVTVLQHNGVVYSGSVQTARTILTVVAETMVAIASLAFATVAVVLTLATSQFGHRLIHSFMRDKPTQFAFGVFVSTFIYALLVLYGSGGKAPLPALSISIAFYLAIIAGFTLIYFTNHIAQMIAAPAIIGEVGDEMDAVIERTWPEQPAPAAQSARAADLRDLETRLRQDGADVTSGRQGYLQTLDTTGLVEAAAERDAAVTLSHRTGGYVFEGSLIARVLPVACAVELGPKIRESMVLGGHRTSVQDLRFAFNQLAEIAVRAMSPALNDPFTALDCVNRIGAGLAGLARRAEPSPWQYDSAGKPRVLIDPVDFDEAVGVALMPIRNYSRDSVIVTLRLLGTLAELAPLLRTDKQRRAVGRESALIRRGADTGLIEDYDRARAETAYRRVLERLNLDAADFPAARPVNSKQKDMAS